MPNTWKYIIFTRGEQKIPILFPAILSHSEVAEGIRKSVFAIDGCYSAGMIEEVEVHYCYGKSITLNTKAHDGDETLIENINKG